MAFFQITLGSDAFLKSHNRNVVLTRRNHQTNKCLIDYLLSFWLVPEGFDAAHSHGSFDSRVALTKVQLSEDESSSPLHCIHSKSDDFYIQLSDYRDYLQFCEFCSIKPVDCVEA